MPNAPRASIRQSRVDARGCGAFVARRAQSECIALQRGVSTLQRSCSALHARNQGLGLDVSSRARTIATNAAAEEAGATEPKKVSLPNASPVARPAAAVRGPRPPSCACVRANASAD